MAKRDEEGGMLEEVIGIYFHAKVTKGGRNFTCAALVAVGDGNGKVGLGYGKAKQVPMAIEKGSKEARAGMMQVNLVGDTVAHVVTGRHGAVRVMLRPASPGTGVKAGGPVRAIMSVVGVHNVVSKIRGNTNPVNVAKAAMDALSRLQSVEEVSKLRGVRARLFHPQADTPAEGASAEHAEPTETVE